MSIQELEIKTTTSPSPTSKPSQRQPFVSQWLGEQTRLMFLQTLLANLSSRANIDRAVQQTQLITAQYDAKTKIITIQKAYTLSEVEADINPYQKELIKENKSALIQALKIIVAAGEINNFFKEDSSNILQKALRKSACLLDLECGLSFKQKTALFAALVSAQDGSLNSAFQKLKLPLETDKKIANDLSGTIIHLYAQSLTAVFIALGLHIQNLEEQAYPPLFEVEFNFQPSLPLVTARWDKISSTFHNVLTAEIDKQQIRCAIIRRKIDVQKYAQQQNQLKKILSEFYNYSDPSYLQLKRILTSLNELEPCPSQSTEALPSPSSLPRHRQNNKRLEEITALTTFIVDDQKTKSTLRTQIRRWAAGILFRIEISHLLGLTDEFQQQMKIELHCRILMATSNPKDSKKILPLFMNRRYGKSEVNKTMENIFLATNEIVPLVEEVASSSFQEAHTLLKTNYAKFLDGYERKDIRGEPKGYEKRISFTACSLTLQIMTKNPALKAQMGAFMESMKRSQDTVLQEIATEIVEIQKNYELDRRFTLDEAKEIERKTKKNKGRKQVQFNSTVDISQLESPIATAANQIEGTICTINKETWAQVAEHVWWGSYHEDLRNLLEEDQLVAPAILLLYKQKKFQTVDQILHFLASVQKAWAEEILTDYQNKLTRYQLRTFLQRYPYKAGRFHDETSHHKEVEILRTMASAYSIWEPKPDEDSKFQNMLHQLQALPKYTSSWELENLEKNWKAQNSDSYKDIPDYIKARTIHAQNERASTPSESDDPETDIDNPKADDLPTSTQATPTIVDDIKISPTVPDPVFTTNPGEDTVTAEPSTDSDNNPSLTPLPETETSTQSTDTQPEITISPLEIPQVSSSALDDRTPNKTNDLSVVAPLIDEKKRASTITETPALRRQFIRLLEDKIHTTLPTQPSRRRCWEFLLATLTGQTDPMSDTPISLFKVIKEFQWRLDSAQKNYNLQQGQIVQKVGVGLLSLSSGLESWAILTLFVLSEYSNLATDLSPTAMLIGAFALIAAIFMLNQGKKSSEIGQAFADESAKPLIAEVRNLLETAQSLAQYSMAGNARDTLFPNPLLMDRGEWSTKETSSTAVHLIKNNYQ